MKNLSPLNFYTQKTRFIWQKLSDSKYPGLSHSTQNKQEKKAIEQELKQIYRSRNKLRKEVERPLPFFPSKEFLAYKKGEQPKSLFTSKEFLANRAIKELFAQGYEINQLNRRGEKTYFLLIEKEVKEYIRTERKLYAQIEILKSNMDDFVLQKLININPAFGEIYKNIFERNTVNKARLTAEINAQEDFVKALGDITSREEYKAIETERNDLLSSVPDAQDGIYKKYQALRNQLFQTKRFLEK